MKREITVMAICAMALLIVLAYFPNASFSKPLVLIIEAANLWAFVSAFRKA